MTEVLIAGGGPAGGAAAIHLARAGRRVTLVERSSGPHDKVCGEFLSGEALTELSMLDIDPAAMGAPALTRLRLAATGKAHAARLPFRALSLKRRALDEAVLSRAEAAGVRLVRGVRVTRTERSAAGWTLHLSAGDALVAPTFIAATGKHDLRGGKRPSGIHSGLVGLKSYYRLTPSAAASLAGTVDMIFFAGGYCGIQPVETGEANACLVLSRERLAALGGDPWAAFEMLTTSSAHANEILAGARRCLDKPLAVARVPYGYVRGRTDGPYHVGDQAAVIPSFCGEGMGLALRSGRLAAEAILADRPASAFQHRFARLAYVRVKGTALLSRASSSAAAQRSVIGLASVAPKLVTALAAATRTPQASRHS